MNQTFKPYRLISCAELRAIQKNFEHIIHQWNDEYALHPLNCSVSRTPKILTVPPLEDYILIGDVALLVQPDWAIIKHCLFGDHSACFDAQSKSLFSILLNQLLGTQSLQLKKAPDRPSIKDWFYTGAPSLVMTINQVMTIYLHPQWVLSALPLPELTQHPLAKLSDALAAEKVNLHVELNPVPLKLTDMVRLKVGDVIKTDHLLTTPLRLSINQKTICSVDIGKENSHKSIQITRT